MAEEKSNWTKTIAVGVVVTAMAVIYQIPSEYKTIDFVSKYFNVDLKQRLETKPLKEKATEDLFRSPPKVSEFSSCAVFLSQIKSLTLDDFYPIDNQSAEDLTLSDISGFNNLQLGPRIQSIVRMDYFKFVKLNLHRRCILWPDATKCVLK